MQQGFELLEQRVRKAAELVQRLRQENESLAAGQARLQGKLEETERALSAARAHSKTSEEDAQQLASTAREVKAMRQERDEIRRRIEKLVEVLDGLD